MEREGSAASTAEERDFAEFLDDVEEDAELREALNVVEVEAKLEVLEINDEQK